MCFVLCTQCRDQHGRVVASNGRAGWLLSPDLSGQVLFAWPGAPVGWICILRTIQSGLKCCSAQQGHRAMQNELVQCCHAVFTSLWLAPSIQLIPQMFLCGQTYISCKWIWKEFRFYNEAYILSVCFGIRHSLGGPLQAGLLNKITYERTLHVVSVVGPLVGRNLRQYIHGIV